MTRCQYITRTYFAYNFRYTGSVYHHVVHRQVIGPQHNESGTRKYTHNHCVSNRCYRTKLCPNFEAYGIILIKRKIFIKVLEVLE